MGGISAKPCSYSNKCNPPLNEWLISPIVYVERGQFTSRLRELAPTAYNPVAARYHYCRMAANNFREYLQGEVVRRKKYFYVLRPLLAVNWIESGKGVVPIEFDLLVSGTLTDAKLLAEIGELLKLKRSGSETDEGSRFEAIHGFIETEMERQNDDYRQSPGSKVSVDELNHLFRKTVEDEAPVAGDSL